MGNKEKSTGKDVDGRFSSVIRKIINNRQEDKAFADVLTGFEKKAFLGVHYIKVAVTPNALVVGGANKELDLFISPNTIAKCMSPPCVKYPHGHELSKEVLQKIIHELQNPLMVLKGSKDNTLVAVTRLKDRAGDPIMVSVALDRQVAHHKINQITSAYGKRDFGEYFLHQLEKGTLVAANKNKANKFLQSYGLQLPAEESFVSFGNSIAYSLEKVNSFLGKSSGKNLVDSVVLNGCSDNEKFETGDKKEFSENDILDMIGFFEYAGDEIYNSDIWSEFQKDKEFMDKSGAVARIEDVLSAAKRAASENNKSLCNDKKAFNDKGVDLFELEDGL